MEANNPSNPTCDLQFSAEIAAGENAMDGGIVTLCPPNISVLNMRAERCGCLDGNSSNGDGCDSLCRVEPCYSCSGEPSVCSPLADGSSCDDRMTCTVGETCTSAVCSGGSPVPPPCVDMAGGWLLNFDFDEDPFFPIPPDSTRVILFTQQGTEVHSNAFRGTISHASGYIQLHGLLSGSCGPNYLTGTVAADALTLTATYSEATRLSFSTCSNFDAVVTGTRCGGGTLDPNEECDDGDANNGDGCNAQCEVEPCYDCSGSPSTCTPHPDSTACDDGDACTSADDCQAGVCGGTPVACGPCLSCDTTGQCVAAPRTGCLVSTEPSQTSLTIVDSSNPTSDTLAWVWRKGEETDLTDLGDPTATTAYELCVYDESTSPPTALFSAEAAQAVCPDNGCWTSRRTGFTYRNTTGAGSRLTRMDLRARKDGRAKVVVRGKGSFLDPPAAPLALPLRVQLQAIDQSNDLQTCFEAEYAAPGVRANDDGAFRGRATGP